MLIKVAYIAGPFRGPTAWDIEQNVRRAEALALEVFKLGIMPLCPHANTRYFHGQGTDDWWLAATQELLRRCDVAVMTPDWQLSEGARAEHTAARERNMPVFYAPDLYDLRKWYETTCGD